MEERLLSDATKFFLARLRKLRKKERLGWHEYRHEAMQKEFRSRIRKLVKGRLTQKKLVNIANYCNFLWINLEIWK